MVYMTANFSLEYLNQKKTIYKKTLSNIKLKLISGSYFAFSPLKHNILVRKVAFEVFDRLSIG